MVTNIESEFLVSPFSNNHKFPFETTHSFHGFKRRVLSARRNSGQKNSGALCQAIWDLTQSPATFSQSRFKFNRCVDINLRDQSAVKNHAPECSLRWCREKSWTKPYLSPNKKYKSQCIGKQNGVCDSIFKKRRVFTIKKNLKNKHRALLNKTSTIMVSSITKPMPFWLNIG